jgi:adenylosuccinate synthase
MSPSVLPMSPPTLPANVHVAVVGLGFGDEGKGATVDWLCATRPVSLVVRYNGGAQAAHNVVVGAPAPGRARHHCFHQLGSGTLAGVPTWLGPAVLVEPITLAAEAQALAELGVRDPLGGLTIHPAARVTTAIHVAANRTREDRRGAGRHGSCGLGVGETVWYDLAHQRGARAGDRVENLLAPADMTTPALRVADCRDRARLVRRLDGLARCYAPLLRGSPHGHPTVAELAVLYEEFAAAVAQADERHLAAATTRGPVVFEGAQGALLDEWFGFHPHTTWSTTTAEPARRLLAAVGAAPPVVLGVTRAYHTRHGAGPFVAEEPALADALPEVHNGAGDYQGGWRVGHLDLVALRYGAALVRPDAVALTHLDAVDRLGPALRVVDGYRFRGRRTGQLAHRITGRIARRLPVPTRPDLARQGRLTARLFGATPVGRRVCADEVVRLVEEACSARVLVTADGPDRADRVGSWSAHGGSAHGGSAQGGAGPARVA